MDTIAHSERAQTSAEYVSVVAVGVAFALGILFVLSGPIATGFAHIGDTLNNFVDSIL